MSNGTPNALSTVLYHAVSAYLFINAITNFQTNELTHLVNRLRENLGLQQYVRIHVVRQAPAIDENILSKRVQALKLLQISSPGVIAVLCTQGQLPR